MSFVKIYVHLVWGTYNRAHLLYSPELRLKVWKHIKGNADRKGFFIDVVNGYSDHCHCLISLSSDQTIEKIVNLIKGESSYWINHENLIRKQFRWQNEYFAVSISESILENVRNYIINQENHHKRKTFADEYNEFLKKYRF